MKRACLVLMDATMLIAFLAAIVIFASGGGTFEWHGHVIRAARARNALWVFFSAAFLRKGISDGPFLGRWPFARLARAVHERSDQLSRALDQLTAAPARRWVLIAIAGSVLLKLWNVYRYYGFYYGDDVEIHVMTFSVLRHVDLGAWDLRSPFYPLTFIFPVQWLLSLIGVIDPAILILAGRVVVAGFSCVNVWLTYRIGHALSKNPALGLLGAFLLAFSGLHVRLASTELPRTVSTAFLLFAYLAVLESRAFGSAMVAGLSMGVAASMRFSEAIFVIPLAVQLGIARRYRDLLIFAGALIATLLLILGPGDLLFWPEMFHSVRQIVDFTILRGESSRGFEPLWHYVATAPWWTDPCTLFLMACGWRLAPFSLRLWAATPVLVLSCFPHKEERYLVPVLPFLLLIAAYGAKRLLEGLPAAAPRRRGLILLLLCGATTLELEASRFPRLESAVDVARFVAERPGVRNVAMEGVELSGLALYLTPPARAVSIAHDQLNRATYFEGILRRPEAQYVVMPKSSMTPDRFELTRQAGFTEIVAPAGKHGLSYRVFFR